MLIVYYNFNMIGHIFKNIFVHKKTIRWDKSIYFSGQNFKKVEFEIYSRFYDTWTVVIKKSM